MLRIFCRLGLNILDQNQNNKEGNVPDDMLGIRNPNSNQQYRQLNIQFHQNYK